MVSQGDNPSRLQSPFFRSLRAFGGGLLAALLTCSTPVFAVHNTGVFELDGNSATSGAVDDFDAIFSGPGLSVDRSFLNDSATPDTSFHATANDDRAPIKDWRCVSSTNPQDIRDLRYGYSAAYMINGELHLFFGANRKVASTNPGDADLGFWLFQQPVQCSSSGSATAFTGHKTDGDLFIVSSFDNSGTNLSITVYRWTDPDGIPENGDEFLGNGITSGVAMETGADCTLADPHASSERVCGVVNTGSITTAWDGALGVRQYFEGGLNLSSLFQRYAFGPVCYTTFMAETRGSETLNGQPFDYVVGDLSTCGSLTVDTITDPSGDTQLFNFAIAGGPDALSDPFQLADSTLPQVLMDLKPGTYTITETVPSLFDLTGATCVGGPFGGGGAYTNGALLALNFGDHVTCTFNNFKKRGRITVDKVTAPSGESQLFSFNVAGPGVNDAFQLADATAPQTTSNLLPGSYSVTEATPAGWDLSSISCTGGPFGAGGSYANGAAIAVDWGHVINCSYTNTKRGSITVDKVTAPVGDPQSFDFLLAGGPDSINDVFPLTDAASPHTIANLRPGTYTLTETVAAGWDFASATCVGGTFGAGKALANGGTISLTAGAQITCTVTNIKRARITVDKVTTPSGDPQIFKFIINGKPSAKKSKAVRHLFELSDAGAPFSVEVQPGAYRIIERGTKGWVLNGIHCVGGPFGAGNPYTHRSKFTLNPTEQVVCTVSNSKK